MSYSTSSKGSIDYAPSAQALELLYDQYLINPSEVDVSWRRFFEGYEFAIKGNSVSSANEKRDTDEANVEAMINAFRRLGHLSANVNPLLPTNTLRAELQPESLGVSNIDPNRIFNPSNFFISNRRGTFQQIYDHLKSTYCQSIGADYRDINQVDEINWLQEKMESSQNRSLLSVGDKKDLFQTLVRTEGFEKFLQDRFLGQKRFSVEGLDNLINLLRTISDQSAKLGIEELNLAMAHRGRLNVLANFLGKPYGDILQEFEGSDVNPQQIEGDVKYHKGFCNTIKTPSGQSIRVYLSPNPSHLEAVNPVLEGFTKSRQKLMGDQDGSKILPILIHGDSAVIGQGVVAETLNFAMIDGYSVGGTVHIIANNQLGFTANPNEYKSCDYSSDIMKIIRAPVFHVNADDTEAVYYAATLAVEFRQAFKKDVVIDLIGYRRHGHNETDEPAFTQPTMYKSIRSQPSALSLYSEKLKGEGIQIDLAKESQAFRDKLQDDLDRVRAKKHELHIAVPPEFKKSLAYRKVTVDEVFATTKTNISLKALHDLGVNLTTLPESLKAHSKISKLFEQRRGMFAKEAKIDWGMAELLAYAANYKEGFDVRLTGQDCRRGTFSHRHAVIFDTETNTPFHILRSIQPERTSATADVINSPLSEEGCLGFEFGYSVANPEALVLWEAQFGDFVNGAQIILDQFLVSSEAKWKQTSNLVLLLPHGYEGQGPEHSSARPERFLQGCSDLNIQVVNPTLPAQFFHVLRRQVKQGFPKPLIVLTPKSLLRHPEVVSDHNDFCSKTFEHVLDDPNVKTKTKIKRVVLCTGKLYYDLRSALDEQKLTDVAIVRIEQLYPFPAHFLKEVLAKYKKATEIVWAQEEPVNMGWWTYIRPRVEKMLVDSSLKLAYVGRRGAGTTAEGSIRAHQQEQKRIVDLALKQDIDPVQEAFSL